MTVRRIAAAAAHFGRDVSFGLERVRTLVARSKDAGADLLVLPDGVLGGYLADLRHPDASALPPAFAADDPVFGDLAALAGDLTLCLGYTEVSEGQLFNTAVCLSGAGVHGRQRKVHQPRGVGAVYSPGDRFAAFDSPVGRLGMLLDYDKTFPEAARSLATDGARTLAVLSAWPASITRRATSLASDRQTRLFDLYDCARAAENQIVVVSANQTGTQGGLRFLGSAKVVGPGGEVLARTGVSAGLAIAEVDVDAEVDLARRVLFHLSELRPQAYTAGDGPPALADAIVGSG